MKVEGKEVVGVFVGQEWEGCLVVPHRDGEERAAGSVGPVGCVELSKLSGWPHISRAAGRSGQTTAVPRTQCGTYRLFLDTVAYTLYNALYGVDMIPRRLVIPKPHHSPPFYGRIPMHFNNPILELFSRHLHPTKKRQHQVSPGRAAREPVFQDCNTHRSHSSSVTCITSYGS